MADVWRNDRKASAEVATISSVVIAANDVVATIDDYTVYVRHVFSFPGGKGFMPAVDSRSKLRANGSVHCGIDQSAYDKAVEEGRQMALKIQEEDIADIQKYLR